LSFSTFIILCQQCTASEYKVTKGQIFYQPTHNAMFFSTHADIIFRLP